MTPKPIKVVIENKDTGEIREWHCDKSVMTIIYRALKAYRYAPAYLAGRFWFK